MLALAGFLDTLRLAADEGDRSRPIDCHWRLMTEDGAPVRASNGVRVEPDHGLVDPVGFDYIVVAGGTLHRGIRAGSKLDTWLQHAAGTIPLIGICTGSFVLARAGLMHGRTTCVSWFHRVDFEVEFPDLPVCSDQLFLIDRDRITCAGGTSVVQLASHLVERHLGAGRSHKGLRVMIEDGDRAAATPQPLPDLPGLDRIRDTRLRSAVLLIERHLIDPLPFARVADAVGLSPRQLRRLFGEELGCSPIALRRRLRLARAQTMLRTTSLSVTEVALGTGFADAAHLGRQLRTSIGATPRQLRKGNSI